MKRFGARAARRAAALALALIALVSLLSLPVPAADTAASPYGSGQQIVHAGFFRFGGYHEMDSSGEKSGYGYEFLQMIAGYADFRYVYVGYQKTWADMLDMLDSGEIDLLTYGVRLPEYEERFDFSEHSIGTNAELLTASASDSSFAAAGYTPFSGMRIGMIEGANRKAALDAYAAEKGITYTPVWYPDIGSLQAALSKGGEIDAMAADELRVLAEDEVIVDRFDTQDLYVMVKKGNTQLLSRIDEAIRKLNAASPGWALELQSRYFQSGNSGARSVTLAESRYIQDLVSSGRPLRVLFNPARYPFSFYQNGEPAGVLVSVFGQIASEYGLPYEFLKAGSADEYYAMRQSAGADIILDFAESTDEAEVLGYRLTSSYAGDSISIVTLRNSEGSPGTAAVISDSGTFAEIARENNSRMKLRTCESFADCVDAVRSGAADCAYTYSLTAQIFVIEDSADKIRAAQLNDTAFQFRLAVNADADMLLYALLNQATHSLNGEKTTELMNSYLLSAKRNPTLWDYLTENPLLLIAVSAAVMAVLLGFLLSQRRSASKLRASNEALNASRDALEDALNAANDANAAKTRFLSQMSHDIRTPLNGIIGMTGIARENTGDPVRLADALDKISRSSDHLLTLINDILDLSRIESGRVTLAHDPTDIRTVIARCAEVLRSSAIGRELSISVETAPVGQPFVRTDALHLRQILINIISNAVKFTPDGGSITFRSESRPSADGGTLLCRFTVRDDGIGMSEEFQQHIFEPFVQEDEVNSRTQFKGSGLGMSIVKQYVEMFGGTITISSRQNEGTEVVVELPLEIDRDAAGAGEPAGAEGEQSFDFAGVRVLLAEDNEINAEIARSILESRGILVDAAADGKEAVDRFAASSVGWYRCILMDIMMPNMDGYEATRTIRTMDRPDAKTVPIIAMTANAFAEDVSAAHENGMNDHIAKPLDVKKFLDTLAANLRAN